MNLHLFSTRLTLVYNRIKTLMEKKNKDYSSADDIHANFKRVAQICDIYDVDVTSPAGVMRFFVLHKFDRYMNLTRGEVEPENESLEDTTIDSHVYQMLLNTFLQWKQVEGVVKSEEGKLGGASIECKHCQWMPAPGEVLDYDANTGHWACPNCGTANTIHLWQKMED